MDYDAVDGLSSGVKEKLAKVRPATIVSIFLFAVLTALSPLLSRILTIYSGRRTPDGGHYSHFYCALDAACTAKSVTYAWRLCAST